MPILIESFELERCCDASHHESFEFADTECCSPPPPQKFPLRATNADGKTSKSVSPAYVARYKQQFCRAVGAMIAMEEAAQWVFSDHERELSALMAGDI
jgi:hypothetical protein